MQPPLSYRLSYLRTRVCRDITRDLTFDPLTPAPYPENSYRGHYSLMCVIIGMAGRRPQWCILGGTCIWGGGKCPARVTYKDWYDFISILAHMALDPSLYLALRARIEKYGDDVRRRPIVPCTVPVCYRPICRKVVSAGAATAAGWSQGAGCLDSIWEWYPIARLPQLTAHSWLADCCRLASKPQEVCPLAHPPLPKSSCHVGVQGGGKCLMHVKLVNIV